MQPSDNAGVNLAGSGYVNQANVDSATTLAVGNSGIVQNVTATATVTLPTSAVGDYFIVRVGADNITVTIAPQSTDTIKGGGLTATEAASITLTDQPAGSFVELLGAGTNTYVLTKVNGVIAN